jgi:hypothetical protein
MTTHARVRRRDSASDTVHRQQQPAEERKPNITNP